MLKRCLLTLLMISFSNVAWTEMAPKLTVHDAKGQSIELPRQQEGADVYLFWASWCRFCKIVMPEIDEVSSGYGDDVTVLAFQIRDEDVADAEAFISQLGYNFEVIPAADETMEPFGVQGTPGLFVVDSEGRISGNLIMEMMKSAPEDFKNMDAEEKASWVMENTRKLLEQALDVALVQT
jgi:thiol-disulfide isomerase/thioredoxin